MLSPVYKFRVTLSSGAENSLVELFIVWQIYPEQTKKRVHGKREATDHHRGQFLGPKVHILSFIGCSTKRTDAAKYPVQVPQLTVLSFVSGMYHPEGYLHSSHSTSTSGPVPSLPYHPPNAGIHPYSYDSSLFHEKPIDGKLAKPAVAVAALSFRSEFALFQNVYKKLARPHTCVAK